MKRHRPSAICSRRRTSVDTEMESASKAEQGLRLSTSSADWTLLTRTGTARQHTYYTTMSGNYRCGPVSTKQSMVDLLVVLSTVEPGRDFCRFTHQGMSN